MTNSVLFEEKACADGKFIGIATLNNPKALNALNLTMVGLLLDKLSDWNANNHIALVILHSDLEKAFCAGGDVISLYSQMKHKNPHGKFNLLATEKDIPSDILLFFSLEYKLDYLIHTFSKPVLVWGNGIVMGGGLGLFSGASHRIVTPSSRIAMPEVSVGLYPDVGGSWFLNKMPDGCGLFLGMTGSNVFAADAIYLNLADYIIENEKKSKLLEMVLSNHWDNDNQLNQQKLTTICLGFSNDVSDLDSQLAARQSKISQLAMCKSVQNYCDALLELDSDGDSWLARAQSSAKYGSPITQNLVFQQLTRGNDLSLADCFKMELIMTCRCVTFGEFQEGVRALLIDKDKQPKWWAASPENVSEEVLSLFFISPWAENQHPLKEIQGLK